MPSAAFQFDALEPRRLLVVPVVIAAQFEFLTAPHRIVVQFNTDVSASLSNADLRLQNHTTMTRLPTASLTLASYNTGNNTATFNVNGILLDGNYRLRVLAPGITNTMGEPMASDAKLDFFVHAGDADHNRSIDIDDFGAMAANFNAPGTFGAGDFNYSGTTNIDDFAILASNFNDSLPALSAPTTRYTVTRIPAPASQSGTRVFPYSMNDNGMVAGMLLVNPGAGSFEDTDGFSWLPGESAITTGSLADARSTGVNNQGNIVGWSEDAAFYAVLYRHENPSGGQLLNPLSGNPFAGSARALGINNANVIVGQDRLPPNRPPESAVRWTSPTSVQEIGVTLLTAINDAGDMVGDGPKFYPSTGGSTTIGTAGGLAMAVNINREVVGVSGTFSGFGVPRDDFTLYKTSGNPFYWKPGMAEPFLLEAPDDLPGVQARGINNAGVIVGSGDLILQTTPKALIWKEGMPYDLEDLLATPDPGLTLFGTADINEQGQILAYGFKGGGHPSIDVYGFVLTPVVQDSAVDAELVAGGNLVPAHSVGAAIERPTVFSTSRLADDLFTTDPL